MPRYIEENEIYNLFNARGVAQLHVGDIDVLPRVDAKEVVYGQWVMKETMIKSPFAKNAYCSVCLEETSYAYNYCPNCGAKMSK
jgi:hypothetical protein